MQRLIIGTILSFYSIISYAELPSVIFSSKDIHFENFPVGYFVDDEGNKTISQIQQQTFHLGASKNSLGTTSHTLWLKIKTRNTTSETLDVYLHHNQAYHYQVIELYESVNGNIQQHRLLNTAEKSTFQWMYGGAAIFDILLPPKQEKILYLKLVCFSYQWFSLDFYDANASKHSISGIGIDTGILSGMLVALAIYNFFLFIPSRRKYNLYYAFYLISGGTWIALAYGLIGELFHVYGTSVAKLHLALGAMPIFLLLFMIDIFKTKTKYVKEHKALVTMILLLALNMIDGLFNMARALSLASSLAAIMMMVSLLVGISLTIKKQPLAWHFLLGHSLFVCFSGTAVLFYKGLIPYNYVTSHGVGIGIMFESLVLALIIAYRLKMLEQLESQQKELVRLAETDHLTELLNRRSFYNQAEHLLNQLRQTHTSTSIALIDIDHFKKVNDTYGHSAGDKAIVHVAKMLQQRCRSSDIVARFGGEEFVILLPNTLSLHAYVLTEHLRCALQHTPIWIDADTAFTITISVGVVQVDHPHQTLSSAIHHADTALYTAKNNGRNQSQIYDAAMDQVLTRQAMNAEDCMSKS